MRLVFSLTAMPRWRILSTLPTGTGILSLFAARAGARKVIAIDASDVVKKAKQIVEDNDMQDVIT